MPVRDNPLIEEALAAIHLAERAPEDERKGVRLPFRPAAVETGKVTQEALWLHYAPDTKISFDRLLKEIDKALGEAGHQGRMNLPFSRSPWPV